MFLKIELFYRTWYINDMLCPILTTVPIPVAARFKAWVGVKQIGWTQNLREWAEKDYEKPNDSQCPGSHSNRAKSLHKHT